MATNPILRNTAALIGGFIIGSIVNIMLVNIGPTVIPLPEGADISTMEKLAESMKLFTPVNFLFPFLAHALGTLTGAFIAARFSASAHFKLAMAIGVITMLGGIYAVYTLGGPTWFKVTDLVFAYIPMAYLGAILADKTRNKAA